MAKSKHQILKVIPDTLNLFHGGIDHIFIAGVLCSFAKIIVERSFKERAALRNSI